MRKLYKTFCRLEEAVAGTFLTFITGMIFVSAAARTLHHPINWAEDISLLLFAWVVFLGADLALRRADFVRVDMIIGKFPPKVQTAFYYAWYVVAVAFLGILIRYGIPLCFENVKRQFQTLGISYSWATISVPVGSALMILTIILKLIRRAKGEKAEQGKEAI